ncbi:MAG: asparagine synthase [Alphaproteobacteria bacterium]|nr:asparagine synthase [Alphaproteobacteria bacterium]
MIAANHGTAKPRLWRGEWLALAHAQGIVTPEDRRERLPGGFAGGRSVLVFDGRIDNRDDLIAELGLGRAPSDPPDSRLVMAALERWGEDASARLLGDFAFAAWDHERRRLFLACDAVGGRTIYHHTTPHGIVFATSVNAVQALIDGPREVDLRSAAHLLLNRPIPSGATMYRGTGRLPSAGWLAWTENEIQGGRYWRPDWNRRIRYRRDEEYVEAARELLDRVVADQSRAAGPVVCHLSGGLDSTAVASTAARLVAPKALHTVTVVPDPSAPLPPPQEGLIYDEWPLAEAVARRYPNMVAHRTPAGALTADEIDPTRLFWAFGLPIRNLTNYGCFMPGAQKVRQLGGNVVLTGLSGNMTLSWRCDAPLAELAVSGDVPELMRQIHGIWRNGESVSQRLRQELIAPLLPPRIRRAIQRLRGRKPHRWEDFSVIAPSFAAEIGADDIFDSKRFVSDAPTPDTRSRHKFLEQTWAQRPILAALPRVSGLEHRDPLGDRRLVEFCLAIPSELWRRDGVPRSFARRVLADRLPTDVVDSRDHGRQAAQWFHRLTLLRDDLVAEIDRLEASPLASRIMNLPRLRAIASDWPTDAQEAERRTPELLGGFGRGLHIGQFLRWVEGGNG